MAKEVTLADIAAQVGVSSVAVSKALSGKKGVSDDLRERIKQVAEQMGYVPSASSKAAPVETGNIGVLIPERYYGHSISFYGRLYEQVVKALYNNKYFGILELLTKEDEDAGTLPMVMQDGKVDGLIVMGQMDEDYIKKLVSQNETPIFFIDTYTASILFDTVISDGYYGTYLLTNYLIAQGHKRIGFVGRVDATSSIADRFFGYRRALREHHIHYREEWEIPDRDSCGKIFDNLLTDPGDMDAYVCNSDYTAYTLIQNLEDAGYSVPEDVSVVGFDDFLPAGMDSDRITSYAVDMKNMAEVCVKLLIKKIKHKKYAEGIQIITGKMVLKSTVKKRN